LFRSCRHQRVKLLALCLETGNDGLIRQALKIASPRVVRLSHRSVQGINACRRRSGGIIQSSEHPLRFLDLLVRICYAGALLYKRFIDVLQLMSLDAAAFLKHLEKSGVVALQGLEFARGFGSLFLERFEFFLSLLAP